MNSRAADWAMSFLKNSSKMARSFIVDNLRKQTEGKQNAIEQYALRVLRDKRLKSDEELRDGAVRLIVGLLPKTFPAVEELLSDFTSPLWYEVQFTVFSSLNRDYLSRSDQERVLVLIENHLMNVKSESGYAAWKAGDLLGDEWNTRETVQILERLLSSAKHVAGRRGALHGLQHAIENATPSKRESLFSLIRESAVSEPSAEVRKDASLTLEGVGCHHLKAVE